ncbi:hypothetical protein AAC387_Pa05g3540 [Persea americana]
MNILCQIFEQEDPKNTIHPKISNDRSMGQLNQTTENKSMVPGVHKDWFITGQKIEDLEGIQLLDWDKKSNRQMVFTASSTCSSTSTAPSNCRTKSPTTTRSTQTQGQSSGYIYKLKVKVLPYIRESDAKPHGEMSSHGTHH